MALWTSIPVSRSWRSWRTWLSGNPQALLRNHGAPLAIVLASSFFAQATALSRRPLFGLFWDTNSYVAVVHQLYHSYVIFDRLRTPGYPLFLAAVFALFGKRNYDAVVLAQTGLILLATLESYVLAYRLSGRRWLACLIASLIGGNIFIAAWERTILSEPLAYWLLVTLFLAFERYVRTQRPAALAWLTALFVANILTRPFTVYLPAVLIVILALRGLRLGTLRKEWKGLSLSLGTTYALIVGYMLGNAYTYGYFGLSIVTNGNLFAKIFEYHMQNASSSPQFAQLKAAINAYLESGHTGPWTFIYRTPAYNDPNLAQVGRFSTDIIAHHPFEYALHTLPDIVACWTASPGAYAGYGHVWPFVGALVWLSQAMLTTYLALPVLIIILGIWVWRRPSSLPAVLLFSMMLTAASFIVTTAAGSNIEFYRLRSPADWMMILASVIVAAEGIRTISTRLLARR